MGNTFDIDIGSVVYYTNTIGFIKRRDSRFKIGTIYIPKYSYNPYRIVHYSYIRNLNFRHTT